MTETFYGDFYELRSAPFHITPDPALLFPTETHRAALGAIEYGIAAGKGFIVVTGEVGVGKTTVLRSCLDELDPGKVKVIYLFNPALTAGELYAEILDEFDVTLPPTASTSDTLRTLQRTLLAAHQGGTQVVLAVDEAQRMPEETLESLRLLSNFETHRSKLLQIILVGQPELEAILAKHSLRQLEQRVAVRARVAPLTFSQSCRYITHRARLAGREPKRPLFTMPALLYLARIGRGIPRTINVCCDNALINGYGHGARRITLGIARESCKSMRFRSPLRRALAAATVVMALIGAAVSAEMLIRHFLSARAATNPAVLMNAPSAAPQDARDAAPMATSAPSGDSALTAAAAPSAAPAPPTGSAPAVDSTPSAGSAPTPGAAAVAPSALTPASMPAAASATAPNSAPPTGSAAATGAAATGSAPSPGSAPAPALALTAASMPPATADAEPAAASTLTAVSKLAATQWIVREGDTLYHACQVTYGICDDKALQAVIAQNPKIRADNRIYVGEVIDMPRSNRPDGD
jgi:general secretion pathway protein A